MGRFSLARTAVEYKKRHLSYNEQVELLVSRGLEVRDHAHAVRDLKRIGYYRLSGYLYAFRQIEEIPDEERSVGERRIRRLDTFEPSVSWDQIIKLSDFDQRLRRCLLDGVQQIEVGLRVRVAYTLGKRGPFAHLDEKSLDRKACAQLDPPTQQRAFDLFLDKYEEQRRQANQEEYVKHFLVKYEGQVPIWAATEFLTMGSLIRLYTLLHLNDRRSVAREFGVKNHEVLHGWLKALNVLRNRCAHNARIWNRATVYPPDKIHPTMVDEELRHLVGKATSKLYFLAALNMYLLRRTDPSTRWASDFRTTMGKFPAELPIHTPENAMGFPMDWRTESLWRHD